MHPIPATSKIVCCYAAYLARKLKYRSIKQYMNIIRIMHVECGLPNPCESNYQLNTTLRGIRRHLGDRVVRKEPVTPQMLRKLLSNLDVSTPKGAAIWAAALLMFYGLLRCSNVLPPINGFDKSKHLRRCDLRFERRGLTVCLRRSKTIQFRERTLDIPYPWDPKLGSVPHSSCIQLSSPDPSGGPGGASIISGGRPSPHPPVPMPVCA